MKNAESGLRPWRQAGRLPPRSSRIRTDALLSAFAKALAQLDDPQLRRVLWRGLAAAALVYAMLFAGCWWLLAATELSSVAWLEWLADALGGLGVVVLSLLLFPAVVTAIIGLFLEDVARAVERRHYPGLPPARQPPLMETLAGTARFALVAALVNLLALPLYFVPGVFFVVNGYLLGREYFELAAGRRLAAGEVRGLRRAYGGRLWLAGAGITLLLSLPVINLAAPIVATAAMVHVFEALRHRSRLV